MKALEKDYIQEITWNDVRNDFRDINPEFYQIIEDLSPSKEHKLVKLTYSFGDLIIKNGVLQLPEKIQKKNPLKNWRASLCLNYSSIPLLCLIDKSCEIFILEDDRVVPLKVFSAGKFLGSFEVADYLLGQSHVPPWSVAAGSRSLLTLPKISERVRLKKLKSHFKIVSDTNVFSMQDHWYLFKQIAQNSEFSESWTLSVIAFTDHWFTFRKKDSAWHAFQLYLLKEAWSQSQQIRLKEELFIHWQLLLKAMAQRRIQPNPYVTHTLQHLLFIAQNQAPAFSLMRNNLLAPVYGMQKVLLDIYGLKQHYPTFMSIQMDALERQKTAYYSLAFPTLMTGSSYSKCNTSTIMQDLKTIKLSIETMLINNAFPQDFLKNIYFDFYHVEEDKHGEILSSVNIPDVDQALCKEISSPLAFCSTSSFWRGCIMFRYLAEEEIGNDVKISD